MISSSSCTIAQLTGNIWYFNDSLGLKFGDQNVSKLYDGVTKNNGGTSVLSMDDSLVIYTDGLNAWNTKHKPIQNGTNILGNNGQSTLFLQLAQDSVIHLFTTYNVSNYWSKDSSINGIYHSVIIPDPSNPNNFIHTKNTKLVQGSNGSISAKKASSFNGYWILFPEWNTTNILIYKLDKNGLKLHRRESVLPQKHIGFSQLKISPNGNFVSLVSSDILSSYNSHICIYNFNNQTGELTNYRSIMHFFSRGLEFSPNESFLYIMGYPRSILDSLERGIYQVNIDSIFVNSTLNNSNSTLLYKTASDLSVMSLTPHGQIFITYLSAGRGFSAILEPDSLGLGCEFRQDYITFNNRAHNGSIPNICIDYILQPYFEINNGCQDSLIVFKLHRNRADSVTWMFGDGVSITNHLSSCTHSYAKPGVYKVATVLHYANRNDTIVKEIKILNLKKPKLGYDTLLCLGEELTLNISDTSSNLVVWNKLDTAVQYTITQSQTVLVESSNEYCKAFDTLVVRYINCELAVDSLCYGDSTVFTLAESNLDSAVFTFDDGDIDTFTKNNIKHLYVSEGKYRPSIELFSNGLSREIKDTIVITSVEDDFLLDTITSCEPIQISPTISQTDYHYLWNTGVETKPLEVGEKGLYWLTIERNGCYKIDSCYVNIEDCECPIYIPNSFSPNGDNLNDLFSLWTECKLQDVSMNIYNRWGELLIENSTFWDGTCQNKPCPFGVYLWTISYKDKYNRLHFEKGTVHLLR